MTLTEFLLARLGEEYDQKSRKSGWRAALFAARHVGWGLPYVRRWEAARFADHPDYRAEWRP